MAKTELTQEQTLDIQTSTDTDAECAKRLGVHWKTVESIRKKAAAEQGSPQETRERAHNEDGTFTADNPATPENEAYEAENAPQNVKSPTKEDLAAKAQHDANQAGRSESSLATEEGLPQPRNVPTQKAGKGPAERRAKHSRTRVYRDGDKGCIEYLDVKDGIIPAGWHDSPADCKNRKGAVHQEYVNSEA